VGKDPQQLRAEIGKTRAELDQDLNVLTEKVSPSKVAERRVAATKSAVTDVKKRVMGSAGSAGSSASGVAASVSEAPAAAQAKAAGNPLTAGLIAFGTGWLLSRLLPASEVEARAAAALKDAAAAPLKAHLTTAANEVKEEVLPAAQGAAQSLKGTASGAVEKVKGTATDKAGDVEGRAAQASSAVKDQATDAADDVTGSASGTSDMDRVELERRTLTEIRALAVDAGADPEDVGNFSKDELVEWLLGADEQGAVVLTEADLEAMSQPELRQLAQQMGIAVRANARKPTIVKALMATADEPLE
jgi:uncharacterized protein YjbJ (UPF0337 family)